MTQNEPRKRIGIIALRRKYPHPVRGNGARDGQYCVGGALCREVGMGIDFPRWDQLRDAIEMATPINHYALNDEDNEVFRGTCNQIIEMNDIGNFAGAWRELGYLLRWKPKPRPECAA